MRRILFLAVFGVLATSSVADARGLPAPRLVTPANGARAQQLPTLSWNAIRGAARYEYQVAADPRFNSIALGTGPGKGTSRTHNLAATLEKTVADGAYYWRVRGLTVKDKVGAWSRVRKIRKAWTTAPQITGGDGAAVNWPTTALVLRWSSVPYATKYILIVATDPALSNVVFGSTAQPAETQGTSAALPTSLAPGAYYWAVVPRDAEGHRGVRSRIASFQWTWPTTTNTSLTDLNPEAGIFAAPMFSWNPIAGAARYEVEVNSAQNFAPGSKWCCTGTTTGTSLAPLQTLANNRYYWRVRAIDARGNAGLWNYGQSFEKTFDPTTPTVRNLTVRNAEGKALAGVPETDTPIVTWDPVPGASLYEVQLGIYHSGLGCDFSLSQRPPLIALTASTAWTPIAQNGAGKQGPSEWPPAQAAPDLPASGQSYCLRVLARTDDDAQHNQVISAWSQINGANQPAFRYVDLSAETEATNTTEEHEEAKGDRTPCPATRRPLTQRGAWDIGTTYAQNDIVVDPEDGSSYISLASGNNGHKPSSSPQFWSLLTLTTPACAYRLPTTGTSTNLTPLLTWKRVALARGYYVVIARDARFTEVADVGFTNVPAYAPRLANESPLSDETTHYYWAVIPTAEANGKGVYSFPCFAAPGNPCESTNDNPQWFDKSSNAPQSMTPAAGAAVSTQPTFRWSPAENARTYRLQVAQDPTFGKLIDDVTTDATAYTSSSTYPADTAIYWRVRATDWSGQGLNWSPAQTFVRRLPVPSPDAGNPTSGLAVAPLAWAPVQGAISYDVHVEKPDGTAQDFNFESPSFTVPKYYGPGIWHWQVRADFPTALGGKVAGGYSSSKPFLLGLATPSGARGVKSGGRLVISWHPESDAKQYEVDVSTTNGFNSRIDSHKVDGSSWSPDIDLSKKQNRGTLYWRVAAIDWGGNVGSFATGTFGGPPVRCSSSHAGKKGRKSIKKTRACANKPAAKKHPGSRKK